MKRSSWSWLVVVVFLAVSASIVAGQSAPTIPSPGQSVQQQPQQQPAVRPSSSASVNQTVAVPAATQQKQLNVTASKSNVTQTVIPEKPASLFPENEILRESTKEISQIENNHPNQGPVLSRTQRLEKYRALKERVQGQFDYIKGFLEINNQFVTQINATHQVKVLRATEAQERLRLLSEALANLQQVIEETRKRVDEEQRIDMHNRVFLEYNGTRTRTLAELVELDNATSSVTSALSILTKSYSRIIDVYRHFAKSSPENERKLLSIQSETPKESIAEVKKYQADVTNLEIAFNQTNGLTYNSLLTAARLRNQAYALDPTINSLTLEVAARRQRMMEVFYLYNRVHTALTGQSLNSP